METPLTSKDFSLPQVLEALAPYIKTRHEALRIRRILSLYLTSHIKSADGEVVNNVILSAPGGAVQVPKVPIELSGLRKDYLRALQANIKARNEHKELTRDAVDAKSGAASHSRPTYSRGVEDRAERLGTYLSLLQERRVYEKLSILRDYLEILGKKGVATPEYLSTDRMRNDLPPMPEAPSVALRSVSPDSDTEILIHRLERTVLQAKHALETEKSLIAKLKDEQETKATSVESPAVVPELGSKVAALCRTRDELIKWMEEQLAKSSQMNEDASLKDSDLNLKGEDGDIDERKAAVAVKYEQYMEARKGMIAAASEVVSNEGQGEGDKEDQVVDPHIETDRQDNDQQATWILPYLTEYLIPSAGSQKAFLQQESHIAKTLSTQQNLTTQLLDRLANESHLLPNYPLLARQPRFKNSVAALGSKQLSPPLHESRSVYEARAWAFAADAARSATHEVVQERLEHGFTYVENARDVLDELRKVLGSDCVDEEGRGESIDLDDMAVSETMVKRRQPPKSKMPARRGSEGIWSGMNGKVGLRSANPV
ncbi:MAG: hypothetical protein FRX48_00838 [Lasallia pustulata]|uniref:Uncharacterized protein n=1 Tax=Lasallia pustulata TaxID=136370 RepID=A0A5M8Q4V9_9LECA|nr:MAG: hypothetical protein FRX48_00838 [Lasallia pustulata]